MYTRRNYGFWQTLAWSKKPLLIGLIYGFGITALFIFLKTEWTINIALPWSPIGIVGISVAFYLGFKNNSSYDRTWEARKIWGGIVNNSRTFGVAITSFVQGVDAHKIKKQLMYRHLAWLTALRYQLRTSRDWEHVDERITSNMYPPTAEKCSDKLQEELSDLLSKEELELVLSKSNIATHILAIQANELQRLRDLNYFEDFRHMEFHKLVGTFFDDQGRSERIKNFPFPRQYASTALWQAVVFAALIPFGLLDVFGNEGIKIWLIGPISGLIIWIFFLMEKIGDYSENPFEGTYNDVPITAISRAIEIDLREMIHDTNIPKPLQSVNGFLM